MTIVTVSRVDRQSQEIEFQYTLTLLLLLLALDQTLLLMYALLYDLLDDVSRYTHSFIV